MTNTQNVPTTSQHRKLINDAIAVYEDALIGNYIEYTQNLRAFEELQSLSITLNILAGCDYQIGNKRILDLIPLITDILEYNSNDDIPAYQYESKNKAAVAELNKSLDEIYSVVEKTTVTENSNNDITDDELFNIPADLHLSVAQAASEARINAKLAEVAEEAVLEALKFTNALRKQPHHTSTDSTKSVTSIYKEKLLHYVNHALKRVEEAESFRDNYFLNIYNDKKNQ